ncbi:MAG: hypothetical protein QM713_04000 [Arachnia sp.]
MTIPTWLAPLASLDDDALSAASNRGLVRRAAKLADRVAPTDGGEGNPESSHTEVVLTCDDATIRLLPTARAADRLVADIDVAARCDCPAAGVCVHIVAACLWARTAQPFLEPAASPAFLEPAASTEPSPSFLEPAASTESTAAVSKGPAPDSVAGMTPTQCRAARDVADTVEAVVCDGVSQLAAASIDRLARSGERTRLEGLGLLARLVGTAVGRLRALHRRADDASESACLSALAQAWALADALARGEADPALIGARGTRAGDADVGPLLPLAVRWWRSPSGARGVTFHGFDQAHGRVEEATNGRAAGADPSFQAGWDRPLLWGLSPAALSSGVVTLTGAERRPDGTLGVSTRTRAAVSPWGELDVPELAARVDVVTTGAARAAFGATAEPLRVIVPRRQFGLGAIEVDEVSQQLVWPVVDTSGRLHRLTLPADERSSRVLSWLVAQRGLLAVTVIGLRPEAAFVQEDGRIRLVSLTLSQLGPAADAPSWLRRVLGRDQQVRAAPPAPPSELARLCAACADVLEALGATGRAGLPARHAESLTRRAAQADDLGLGTLAGALRRVLASPSPAAVLWARFVLDRVEALAERG